MQFYLIGSMIFAFIVAIFALWNATEVAVRFPFVEEFTTSLALVIIGSAMLGALVVTILGIVKHVKTSLQIGKLTKTVKEHEATIERLQKQNETKECEEKARQNSAAPLPEQGFGITPEV